MTDDVFLATVRSALANIEALLLTGQVRSAMEAVKRLQARLDQIETKVVAS